MLVLFVLLLCWISVQGNLVVGNVTTIECGSRNTSTLWLHGIEVTTGEFPWNIAIYWKSNSTTGGGNTNYICAGTLVSARHVITAASCVTDSYNSYALPTLSDMRLAAGRFFYDTSVNEVDSQWRGVSDVIRHELASGRFNSAHDVAVVKANDSFHLTNNVNVACLDWFNILQPKSSDEVFVNAGVARTVNVTSDDTDTQYVLHGIQRYSLLNRDSCLSAAEPNNRDHLRVDMFCSLVSSNDTCWESPGAGLMFQHSSPEGARVYLLGLFSDTLAEKVNQECIEDRLSAYVNVTQYLPWIRGHLV